jgi:hypothetical protein
MLYTSAKDDKFDKTLEVFMQRLWKFLYSYFSIHIKPFSQSAPLKKQNIIVH